MRGSDDRVVGRRSAAVPPSRSSQLQTRLLRLIGLFIGAFLSTFAFNSATVALPFIAADLDAGVGALELVIAVYGAAFAAILVTGGRLGDLVGRHRMFIGGMAVFALASAVAAVAPSMEILLGARALQGVAAAVATPQILATIGVVTEGVTRLRAIALFASAGGLGAVLGQVLGGALVTFSPFGLSWRAVFAFCCVLAIVSALSALPMPRTWARVVGGIDYLGAGWLAVGIGCLIVALSIGPTSGWPAWTIVLLGVVPLAAMLLWRHERRVEERGRSAVVPPTVLGRRPLLRALLMTAVFFVGYGGLLYVFATAMQHGLGLSALAAGLAIAPVAVAVTLASALLTRITRRLKGATMRVGAAMQIAALIGSALIVFARFDDFTPWILIPSLALFGVAQALIFAPLVDLVIAALPSEEAGLSGGLFGTVQQLSLALGVVIAGAIYTPITQASDAQLGFVAELVGDIGFAVVLLLLLLLRGGSRTRRNPLERAGTLD